MDLPPLKCGRCRTCCIGDPIKLTPEDDPSQYQTFMRLGELHLAEGDDGSCIYLGPRGCTIHGRAPAMCKAYDCRLHARGIAPNDPRSGLPAIVEGRRRLNIVRRNAKR